MSNWKEARGVNNNTTLVAVPAIYKFALTAGQTARLTFGNFTRSLQVSTDGDDVRVGTTLKGVEDANSFPVGAGGFGETMQVPVAYVHNAGDESAVVSVLAVLSDVPVPADFGEMNGAHGFDGGDSSTAVVVLEVE